MKKLIIALAAIAAAFSFVSCNKVQIETPSTDLKLNITVSEMDDAATKAVKTGWVNGDKLNIWFDETNYSNPDLVIKYDGSEWNKDATATVSGKAPAASGNLIVLYEGYNDWSQYIHTSENMLPTIVSNIRGGSFPRAQPIAYANNSAISYTYESNTLTANLNSWKSLTKIQVVVTGLDSANASKYALKEQNLYIGTVKFNSTSLTYTAQSQGVYTLGVPNKDGVAFYFSSLLYNSSRTFTLIDISTLTETTYAVSGKTIETGPSKVAAIKLDGSKFE